MDGCQNVPSYNDDLLATLVKKSDSISHSFVPEHFASRRVMEKCGLSHQGELWFQNARIVWYALDASTWRKLANAQE